MSLCVRKQLILRSSPTDTNGSLAEQTEEAIHKGGGEGGGMIEREVGRDLQHTGKDGESLRAPR